jgi:orotate phosphoribosyltransferase
MSQNDSLRNEFLELLRRKSVFHGDFTLASGAKSKVYVDCKLTTLDPQGAWLAGELMHRLIRAEEETRKVAVRSVGGLTMGADPIALATAMYSWHAKDPRPLTTFSVRKTPKSHGQTKLIEGNFQQGDTVVVIDDVITRGESTITALNAVAAEGGKVAFVACLVDREEGGRKKIEEMGYLVFPLFTRAEVFGLA